MLKRKYANHPGWKRILSSENKQSFIHDKNFHGYISLYKMEEVATPLFVTYENNEPLCIADNGYTWLHQLPINQNFAVTTMFNENGQIVQWYIDICENIGLENNIPYFDDLFLDIVILPSGEVFVLDQDELQESYQTKQITNAQYNLALDVLKKLQHLIKIGKLGLLNQSIEHLNLLK